LTDKSVAEILADISRAGIPVIVWKNIDEIEEGLAGLEDLDLLVPRHDFNRFRAMAEADGFVEATHRILIYPGVYHFYRYDSALDRTLHFHVFNKLITGESHIKNYHLPYERACQVVDSPPNNGLSLPGTLVLADIFLLRYYLKVSCLPGWLLLRRKNAGLEREWHRIRERGETVGEWQQDIGLEASFRKVLHNAFEGPKGSLRHIWLGIRLRLRMRDFNRFSLLGNLARRYGQIAYRLANKIFLKHKKYPSSGGMFIAIVGSDGMGKSTLTGRIEEWLGSVFETRRVHLGRPPTTFLTFPYRVARFIAGGAVKRSEGAFGGRKKYGDSVSLLHALHYWMIAYERFQLGRRIEKQINLNRIVLSDRCPSISLGVMDSQRIGMDEKNRFIRFLGRTERVFYSRIPKPDLLIRLKAPEEVVVSRNRRRDKENKETDKEIRKRYAEYNRIQYESGKVISLDVSGELEDVLRELKDQIWSVL